MKKLLLLIILIPMIPWVLKAQSNYCGPYTVSAPIVLSGTHNKTYKNLIITGGSTFCVHIINCYNITFINCKFTGSTTGPAVRIDGHSHNITIDTNRITRSGGGVRAFQCDSNIKIRANMIDSLVGISTFSHGIQFDNVNGPGNQIISNNILTLIPPGSDPNHYIGDIINIYQSNGTTASPIKVYYNNVQGGGSASGGGLGNAGLVLGDVGGSHQDAEYNNLVNTGYAGCYVQGGSFITVKNNNIYSQSFPWSNVGLSYNNFSSPFLPTHDNTITGNKVNWDSGYPLCGCGGHKDTAGRQSITNPQPSGWTANTTHASINSAIVPNPMMPTCALPNVVYIPSTNVFTYGQLVNMTPVNTGASATSYSVSPALPFGLSLNILTGVINGHPAVLRTITRYHISVYNLSGVDTTSIVITVNKASLSITTDNKSKTVGSVNPTLTVTYLGFQLADNHLSLITQPTISTTALTGSPVYCCYPITASGAVATNYIITYHNTGLLAINSSGDGYRVHRHLRLN